LWWKCKLNSYGILDFNKWMNYNKQVTFRKISNYTARKVYGPCMHKMETGIWSSHSTDVLDCDTPWSCRYATNVPMKRMEYSRKTNVSNLFCRYV
jgi:hypothetical protein